MKVNALDIALNSVFPSSNDREKLQNILNRITSKPNELESLKWYFDGTTLDFGMLGQLQHRFPNWWGNKPIDLIWLAKLLFLESVDGKNHPSTQKVAFDGLIKTFFYLAENNADSIEKDDIDQYIGFLMMNTIEAPLLVSRLTPISFRIVLSSLVCFHEWPRTLSVHGLKGIAFNGVFSEKTIQSAAKRAIEIESGGNLTYRDWKEGGSFNYLTLDYGRYYVEHCASFFDENIGLALAIKKTKEKLAHIIEMEGISDSESNLSYITCAVHYFLAGYDCNALPSNYFKLKVQRSWEKIRQAVLLDLSFNLRQIRAIEALRTDFEIDDLAKKVGFKAIDADKREWIRHLIGIREPLLMPEFVPIVSSNDLSECNCFKSVIGNVIDLDGLNHAIDGAYERLLQTVSGNPPPLSFYESMEFFSAAKHCEPGKGILLRFLDNVENSGIVKFVALTGWRESEYGFSLNDIIISPNLDILDQYACPVRYAVHWVVPKTNGNTKLHRDITRSVYRCAYQLSMLVGAKANHPCLYAFITSKKTQDESSAPIQQAVPAMWHHFVASYQPFVQLDLLEELESLKNKLPLDKIESTRLVVLAERATIEQWGNLKTDPLLIEARKRVREEEKRVAFYTSSRKPRNWIWDYRNGKLQTGLQTLLDTYLSEETRALIKALQTEQGVTRTLGMAITNELIGDCLYPTPHAFRHMWAEAVYRRFDGDAGWMIRSQFKHISQSMWLAYIRNKDNRRQHDRVKRQVVSSLLANYLRKSGEGYAGAMDKLLRRLFLKTQLSTIEQLNTAIDQYGMLEIQDIKANPWGYCLLRRRNQAHAQCADGGVPQRHNASPTFCLGCTHNLTQETNIPGILLGISNDLKVLNTPQVPESFRRVSYNTVSNAQKQLRKLGADQDTLAEIEAALKAGAEKRSLS